MTAHLTRRLAGDCRVCGAPAWARDRRGPVHVCCSTLPPGATECPHCKAAAEVRRRSRGPSHVLVAFGATEYQRALDYARARDARHARGTGKHGQTDEDGVTDHLVGVLGEWALRRVLNLAVPSIEADVQLATGDVGPYEVRATAHPTGHLILHDDDPPDRAHVLGLITFDVSELVAATVALVGYYRPCWGLRVEWWRTVRAEGGAYYVPHGFLSPMEELRP